MDDNVEEEGKAQLSINSVPLFIKKLWKMVNDKDAEDIISWSETGDSFVIHDQFEFITKLLPQYFKHQNMASFVRQLNFYNFHKVSNVKDEIQFAHTCFIKDVPEILVFIRRKNTVLKQKTVTNVQDQEVQNLLTEIKNLKGKHNLVDRELNMLKQENAALWNELNSLRMKYTKQSTIINMLIHFLITYIHSHQTSFSKQNIHVSTGDTNAKNIKRGPTLLQIDYKNNKNANKARSNTYTMLEPGTSNSVTYSVKLPESGSEHKRPRKNIQALEEMQPYLNLKKPKMPQRGLTYSIKFPGSQSEKLKGPEIQKSLLEILKENERLCEEDTDDIFSELNTNYDNITDLEEQENLMEDISEESPEDSTTYTISYPSEVQDSHSVQPIIESPEILEEVVHLPQPTVENISTDQLPVNNKFIKKEFPMKTKLGTQKCTITPCGANKKKHVEILDHVILKNNPKKPKFIKIPIKDLQHPLILKNANLVKSSTIKSPKLATTNQNMPQSTAYSNDVNPEGALLEILKENEKLTNDNIKETEMHEPQADNIKALIENPSIDETFVDFYVDQPLIPKENAPQPIKKEPNVTGEPIIKNESFNILDNPKENLSMFVDNTQGEIDMLQDILNNLTSTDLSDILNSDPPNVNLDIEHTEQEATDDEHMDIYMNPDESVDKYFKENFLDSQEGDSVS